MDGASNAGKSVKPHRIPSELAFHWKREMPTCTFMTYIKNEIDARIRMLRKFTLWQEDCSVQITENVNVQKQMGEKACRNIKTSRMMGIEKIACAQSRSMHKIEL